MDDNLSLDEEIKFQSTRPSRASTEKIYVTVNLVDISIHKALAGLDHRCYETMRYLNEFQSTRPSRASTNLGTSPSQHHSISIHKALAGLDLIGFWLYCLCNLISIHKALAGLDRGFHYYSRLIKDFNPQGPRGPRRMIPYTVFDKDGFQSTRPSRASTVSWDTLSLLLLYFNPQGPRGPRPVVAALPPSLVMISIHKALAGLDLSQSAGEYRPDISIHKALAGLDLDVAWKASCGMISIHKALAGLDIDCCRCRKTD